MHGLCRSRHLPLIPRERPRDRLSRTTGTSKAVQARKVRTFRHTYSQSCATCITSVPGFRDTHCRALLRVRIRSRSSVSEPTFLVEQCPTQKGAIPSRPHLNPKTHRAPIRSITSRAAAAQNHYNIKPLAQRLEFMRELGTCDPNLPIYIYIYIYLYIYIYVACVS